MFKENYWDKVIVLTPMRTFNLLDRLALRQRSQPKTAIITERAWGLYQVYQENYILYFAKTHLKAQTSGISTTRKKLNSLEKLGCRSIKDQQKLPNKKGNHVELSLNIDYAACQKARANPKTFKRRLN